MCQPASEYRTIEMHTGGKTGAIILDGFPKPRGAAVLPQYCRSEDAAARLDLHHRRPVLKPRVHPEMYGALIVPARPAAFGVLFMHHSGCSTMCGHATIALGR
jgi:proline racemase